MEDLFTVKGRAVDPFGNTISDIMVAVVDKDFRSDDLLGFGKTNQYGEFHLTFTAPEFHQNLFESEELPDIYVVFSVYEDGKFKAIARHECYQLQFHNNILDLGDLPINGWPDKVTILERQEAIPNLRKDVSRLNLNNELAQHCLMEVVPMVEHLTGWDYLLDEAEILITSDLLPQLKRTLEQFDININSSEAKLFSNFAFKTFFALYDPFSRKIILNEKNCSKGNLDSLKVIIGHELVHVGQFARVPDLLNDYRSNLLEIKDFILSSSNVNFNEMIDYIKNSNLNRQMTNLEGYAYHIQIDFLQNYYNCALMVHHVPLVFKILGYFLHRFGFDLNQAMEIKSNQYLSGRDRYRTLQKGSKPSRFLDFNENNDKDNNDNHDVE